MTNNPKGITWEEAQTQLAQEFQPQEIHWKPEVTTKKQEGRKVPIMRNGQQVAGCTAHIDARDVMNRLDEVVGVGGWSDSYHVLGSGRNVECTLTVMGVSKSDVGQVNESGFADPLKSAYSDALKRAAVKFGIARHLYSLEMQWLPWDGYKIIEKPIRQNNNQPPRPGMTTKPLPPKPVAKKVEQALDTDNGNGNDIDHMATALLADNLQDFAEHAAAVLDGYENNFAVVGALVNKYPADHGLDRFVFGKTKQAEYMQWLADRKAEVTE